MKCNTCDKHFEDMIDKNDHADGCAASLYQIKRDYFILGQDGSKYDMQRYALKSAPVGTYKTGNICDECISKYILGGNAHLIEDGVWIT